jgi:hypothetical protein
MGRGRRFGTGAVVALGCVSLLAACSSSSSSSPSASSAPKTQPVATKPGYLVYWDQNEEVDFLSMPSAARGQLMPAWDLNGQMCVLPDRSGRFVGGYDPTVPNQHNSGGLKPYKQPPIVSLVTMTTS